MFVIIFVELDRFQDASSALLEFLFTLPSALLSITFFFGNFVYVDVIYAHPAPFLFNRLTIFLLWASLIALGSSKPSTKVKTVMPCFICSLRAVAEAGNNFLSLKKCFVYSFHCMVVDGEFDCKVLCHCLVCLNSILRGFNEF